MARRFSGELPILDAKAATGIGAVLNVSDFESISLYFASASNAALTVQVQGSVADAKPDFTAAQSPTNRWEYVQMRDMEDNSSYDGDTGLVLTGTDDFRLFEVNVNGLTWITLNVTARSAGSISAWAKGFSMGGQ